MKNLFQKNFKITLVVFIGLLLIGGLPLLTSAASLLNSISVWPSPVTVAVGTTKQFTANASDINGWPVTPAPTFTWTSSDTAVGTIDATGLFTPISSGVTIISASNSGVTGTSTATVVPAGAPTFAAINLASLTTDLTIGATYQLSALAVDGSNWPVSPQPTFTWSSSNQSVGTVSLNGLFTAVSVGTTTITASSLGVNSNSLVMNVTPVTAPVIGSIYVNPNAAIMISGATKQFSATAYNTSGIMPITPAPSFTWASSNTAVGTIDANGLFTAVSAGQTIISASSAGVTGTATSTVNPVGGAYFSTITIATANGSFNGNIAVGATKQLTATAWEPGGMAQVSPQPTFTWASSNTAVGTVSASGLFTAISPGAVTITASSLGISATSTANVVSATPAATNIYLSPNPSFINVGDSYYLTAQAYDQFGAKMSPQPAFIWSSANTNIATINASNGLVTGVATGTVVITATSGGANGTMNLNIVQSGAPTLTNISINQFPPNNTLQVGQAWGINAVALDQAGANFNPPPTITWSSSNTGVASISATPNFQGVYILTAVGAGTSTITASGGGISGSVILTVVNKPSCPSVLSVSPSSASITIGSVQQLTVSLTDQYGAFMSSASSSIYWLNSSPAVASVNNAGLVTGITPGQTSVTPMTNGCYGVIYGAGVSVNVTQSAGTFGITSATSAGGTISPLGYTNVLAGTGQTYAISANPNYLLSSLTVDGAPVATTTSYSFVNVQANHTISANFSLINFTIFASAGANGSISSVGTSTISAGNNAVFNITPAAGYSIAAVLVDGISAGAVSTYAFTNVQANHTISVSFTPTPVILNNLVLGWNLIGWLNAPTTAEAFGSVNAGVDLVAKWDAVNQLWLSHITNFPLNNFIINTGEGIFVHKR